MTELRTFRSRIKTMEYLPATDLMDHAGNWRRHPQFQRQALEGVLRQVGIVDALTAYYSDRNGGKLVLIDGHLRKDLGGTWPVVILDVDDAEADVLLATLDPLAALAEGDRGALAVLLEHAAAPDDAVQQLFAKLAQDYGIRPPAFEPVSAEEQGRLDQKAAITCPHCGEEFMP